MTVTSPEDADFKARAFVNGLVDEVDRQGNKTGRKVPHSGHWSAKFRGMPWVEQSEAEGWGLELRSVVIRNVRRRMMINRPFHELDQLMPPKDWVETQRVNACRYALAKQWRDDICAKYGSVDAFITKGKRRTEAKPVRWDRTQKGGGEPKNVFADISKNVDRLLGQGGDNGRQ